MKNQICTRCVMDTSEPTITFNEEGVCRFCVDYDIFAGKGIHAITAQEKEIRLQTTVAKIQADGKGKDYDCIIGLSGGVDSSYVAYLVKNLGLRPLAVHLDNGWNAELAVKNIENICKKMDIDLYTHVINWEEFKDLQLSFLKASVRNAEAPTDHAIFAVLFSLAHKYKLKYIIDGVNHATEYTRNDIEAGGYRYSDLKQIKGIHAAFGKVRLKTYPMMSYWKKLYYKQVLGIHQLSILDYVDYNKEDAITFMSNELGWRSYGAKHHESLFTKWHQIVLLPVKFSFDKRKMHFSDLILSGQMSREEALVKLSSPPINQVEIDQLEEYVRKKLGLSISEYHSLLAAKEISYLAYPNDAWISKLYAKFKNK